jgi:biotin operon repressor
MARNQDGYSFALSYEAVNALIPMSRKTYDKAVKELKDNGWLIKVESNSWIFKDKI